MHAQLVQAQRVDLDVLWWTDHDWRMRAHGYRSAVSFDGVQEPENGRQWTWAPDTTGDPTEASHEFVEHPTSTRDAPGSRSVLLTVTGNGTGTAKHQLIAQSERDLYRTSLHGQTLTLDVHPVELRGDAWLMVELETSFRPEVGGRPAGRYTLSYKFGNAGTSVDVEGTSAVIRKEAPVGSWTTVDLEPARDLASYWPDIDGRDAALWELSVAASCSGAGHASGHIDALTFTRTGVDADESLQTQAELVDHYRPEFPRTAQFIGLEVSRSSPHIGWYGGSLTIPIEAADPVTPGGDPESARRLVELIHERSGVASYAHPFGVSSEPPDPAEQESLLQNAVSTVADQQALDCDLLEVGYRTRGGASLDTHVALWDICSARGLFLTGIGANDNHSGTNWVESDNNFVTWIWAEEPTEAALVEALRCGRAYFGDPTRFHGRLDLALGTSARMGQVAVTADESTELTVSVTGIPVGGSATLVQFDIDDRPKDSRPTAHMTDLAAGDFDADGRWTIEIPTARGWVARSVVQDQTGYVVALSNPIWVLPEDHAFRVPAQRQAQTGMSGT